FDKQIATLCLSCPEKHNAFDDQVITELRAHIKTVNDSDARVMVLKADGKHFCAGADLAWMKRMATLSHEDNLHDARQLAALMQELNDLRIPTIARVQGAAYGGAIGLIACSDIAIADEKSRFCLSETKLGLAPATIGPFVVEAIGPRIAKRLFLTAEVFKAQAAKGYQLVHEVVATEQLDEQVQAIVEQILTTGPQASIAAKQLVADIVQAPEDLSERTSQLIADLRVSEEGQNGLKAFFDKQPAPWIKSNKE
ncbi:enoyl-CoA hydratase-related protein, partial [Oleiphilus sp. HI0132]|uniref:enoyl-CoA hydratase-related protein n=1 Tax=Oleiphilus sp. HI0132 TaxID=1822270 RepID=UPI0008390D62